MNLTIKLRVLKLFTIALSTSYW